MVLECQFSPGCRLGL
ncbi:hypothetical protein MTR67_007031 [Solanum verrucosum]|uniref:Uncharacterized protein n=1 Tax=Solanum verrucosum TaxID=315347 RepID=A0AAF0Q4B4_SOLVR|nr:hypothetical protein MTR67_007031 [Solanum verrucosum]